MFINNEKTKAAARQLFNKLTVIDDPLAREWMSGEIGTVVQLVLSDRENEIGEVPHFDFIAHGGFPAIEKEYFDFYSQLNFGKESGY